MGSSVEVSKRSIGTVPSRSASIEMLSVARPVHVRLAGLAEVSIRVQDKNDGALNLHDDAPSSITASSRNRPNPLASSRRPREERGGPVGGSTADPEYPVWGYSRLRKALNLVEPLSATSSGRRC